MMKKLIRTVAGVAFIAAAALGVVGVADPGWHSEPAQVRAAVNDPGWHAAPAQDPGWHALPALDPGWN
ncbi:MULTISPECIES: hypothetical protein [Streptomyces]|uniref:Secreted protein n=2 Tax=Streptomyces hydrogenans TaxID=1873719 RepID=A0ABQ3PFS7_9ACTN|nr:MULTISPECIES: hypothetical protein [Streptomyces]GHI23887.1 hypothetical protein Shyd_52580 [Streptomyces hydrogenans]